MHESPFVHTHELITEFNAAHGTSFRVRSRFATGLQGGAWLLSDETGRRAVLKCHAPPDVALLGADVERVRAAGYPTPAWIGTGVSAAGSAYSVQEFVDGRGATPLTGATTPLLLAVLERQAGLAPSRDNDWPARITSPVRPDAVELVERFDRLTASPVPLPTGDLVHGDFNSCNILLDGSTVAGVIDVEGFGRGTRVFDYACLLREAYVEGYGDDVTDMIGRAAVAVAGPEVLAACAASAAYFIVDFKRHHEPWRISEVIARLCRMADDIAALR